MRQSADKETQTGKHTPHLRDLAFFLTMTAINGLEGEWKKVMDKQKSRLTFKESEFPIIPFKSSVNMSGHSPPEVTNRHGVSI